MPGFPHYDVATTFAYIGIQGLGTLDLADECALAYKKAFLGTAVRVLVLKNLDSGPLLEGVTDRYLFTRFEGNQDIAGSFARVCVEEANPGFLFGRLLPDEFDSA